MSRSEGNSSAVEGKPVRESRVQMIEHTLPQDANPHGSVLGGRVMHLIDMAAAMAALRHARNTVITAAVDSLSFLNPILVGQFILLRASVNRVFTTSMEVGVRVLSENPITGEQLHTSSAYLTFVAIDEEGRPTSVIPVIPETEEEKRRYREAGERREVRLADLAPNPAHGGVTPQD